MAAGISESARKGAVSGTGDRPREEVTEKAKEDLISEGMKAGDSPEQVMTGGITEEAGLPEKGTSAAMPGRVRRPAEEGSRGPLQEKASASASLTEPRQA